MLKKKKKVCREHRTHANPPPKAHTQRLNRRRVCVSATVRNNPNSPTQPQNQHINPARPGLFRTQHHRTCSLKPTHAKAERLHGVDATVGRNENKKPPFNS